MRQRVDIVGGELRVRSRPGKGSTIEANVPLEADGSAE
jgi:signal transduction histidine kinase